MKGGRIKYTATQMRWLEANRMMVIGDYHAAFRKRFKRSDVTAANLHALRKRKRWLVGRDPARYVGRGMKYSANELAWLRDNCTLEIGAYHERFCARFGRNDISAYNLNQLRKRQGWKTGRTGRFPKGAVPWSKGKRLGNNPGSARTQFRKGSRSGRARALYLPIGTEMVRDGYLVRKINDDLPMQARWRAVHLLNWEKVNGPLPEGHRLKCLGGDKSNVELSNWELVPIGLLPRLNGRFGRDYDKAPAELKPTIMAVARLEHQIVNRATARKTRPQ